MNFTNCTHNITNATFDVHAMMKKHEYETMRDLVLVYLWTLLLDYISDFSECGHAGYVRVFAIV